MIAAEGNFIVTGRTNDVLNLGGVKINALLLDHLLQILPGVDDAISFLLPEEDGTKMLVAFLSLAPDAASTDVMMEARIRIASRLRPEAVPDRFIFTKVIPRTENGKPDRRACIALAHEAHARRSQA